MVGVWCNSYQQDNFALYWTCYTREYITCSFHYALLRYKQVDMLSYFDSYCGLRGLHGLRLCINLMAMWRSKILYWQIFTRLFLNLSKATRVGTHCANDYFTSTANKRSTHRGSSYTKIKLNWLNDENMRKWENAFSWNTVRLTVAFFIISISIRWKKARFSAGEMFAVTNGNG